MIDVSKIKETLENIRPYLQEDGGDIEFSEITDEGIVKVKLIGACVDCPLSMMTLRAGIERALLNAVPEIKRVESI